MFGQKKFISRLTERYLLIADLDLKSTRVLIPVDLVAEKVKEGVLRRIPANAAHTLRKTVFSFRCHYQLLVSRITSQ